MGQPTFCRGLIQGPPWFLHNYECVIEKETRLVYSLQCTEYTVDSLQCTEYTVDSLQCTEYTVHSLQCTEYTVDSLKCIKHIALKCLQLKKCIFYILNYSCFTRHFVCNG